MGLGQTFLKATDQVIPTGAQSGAEPPQMGCPTGLRDNVQRCDLEDPTDIHGLRGAIGEDPLSRGTAGDHCPHPHGRGHTLGQ